MTALLSKACHEPCGIRIQSYLERDGNRKRALARDFLNIAGEDAKRAWADRMDRTRLVCGTDGGWGGRRPVRYQHYVISPDPKDAVDLDTLRKLSTAWAAELFGNAGIAGKLGLFEVAIVYHSDNERCIPHAHVIVNNANLDPDAKRPRLHVDKAESRMLSELCQELSAELGLSRVSEGLLSAPRHGSFVTKAERAVSREGRTPWKQKVRDAAYLSSLTSRTLPEFVERCASFGVLVEEKDGDLVYQADGNVRHRCGARRLGGAYSLEGVIGRLHMTAARGEGAVERSWAAAEECILGFAKAAEVDRGTALSEVAFAMRVSEAFGVDSQEGYDRAVSLLLARIEVQEAAGKASEAKTAREAVDNLRRAKAISSKVDVFSIRGGGSKSTGVQRFSGRVGAAEANRADGIRNRNLRQSRRPSIEDNHGSRGRNL